MTEPYYVGRGEYGDQKEIDPKTVLSSDGLIAELDEQLSGEAGEASSGLNGNHRNGYSKKTVLTDTEFGGVIDSAGS